jgi:hypothetical protein
MAINQLSWPVANVNSQIDFSPLSKLGDSINDQIYQSQAEKLIAQLLGQSQQQQAQQQPQQQPTRAAAPPPQAAPRQIDPRLLQPPLDPQERINQGFAAFGTPPRLDPQDRINQGFASLGSLGAPPLSPIERIDQGFASAGRSVPERPAMTAMNIPPSAGPGAVPNELDDAAIPPSSGSGAVPNALDDAAFATAPQPPTQQQQPEPQQAYSPAGIENVMRVIRQKESSGNYSNVTTTRDRTGRTQSALGAYGVMDFNVGPWTREVLGREMSPQEFLNDRNAQDAVAKAKLSQYAQKYGTTGAAKAWFAGEAGMKNPSARDPLGTTVSSYAADFERKLGRDGDLPPEITGGQSRPTGEQPSQAMSFDQVRSNVAENLISPQPARAAGITSEQISALYRNPHTRQLALGFLQKQLDPGGYEFMAAGDGIVRYNKKDGSYTMISTPQKSIAVPENSRIYDPNTKTYVGGGGPSDKDKYGTPEAGERWVDANRKELGIEPIPGGSKGKVGDEVAARFGLAKSWQSTLPELKARVERGDVGIDNPTNHAKALAGIGDPGETQRMISSGQEALSRMLSGAGVPAQEAEKQSAQYGLTARDTKASALSKINALERHIAYIGEIQGLGRGGTKLSPVSSLPDRAPVSGQPEVGKVYHGRPYLGGAPNDPKSWGPRVQ